MLTIFDHFWVRMGLNRAELRQERGRGVAYVILGITFATSVFFGTDMVLNMSGRFG